MRSTSSPTLFMPAKRSISISVRRGLPSTALDTMRLGSRMRMARSALDPFRAWITFCAAFIR